MVDGVEATMVCNMVFYTALSESIPLEFGELHM